MALAKPVLQISKDGKTVSWPKVTGANGYWLRETTGTTTVAVPLGPTVLSYATKPGSSYTVDARGPRSNSVTAPKAPPPPPPPPPPPTRRRVGTAIDSGDLANAQTAAFVKANFDSLTPRWEGKWAPMAGN